MKRNFKILIIAISFMVIQSLVTNSYASDSYNQSPKNTLPSAQASNSSTISNLASAPDNLVTLSNQISKSVVTIYCGNYLGTGWAIKVQLTDQLISAGFKSYIVTNHHVISSCIGSGQVTISDKNKNRSDGKIFSWNDGNDMAGILTTTYFEPLAWQGPAPVQGQWSGVIGNPLGIQSVLSTGIVSTVSQNGVGMTTAAINPGNSGGPVFNRNGVVIGLATAKFVGTEGMGIFHGTLLLCAAIINCPSNTNAWFGYSVPDQDLLGAPLSIPDDGLVFEDFKDPDLLGIMFCATGTSFTATAITNYGPTAMHFRFTDLTTNKVISEFDTPIENNPGAPDIKEEISGGKRTRITPRSGVGSYIYGFTPYQQIAGHTYECGISVVQKGGIGMITSKTFTSLIDSAAYKKIVIPPSAPSRISIICQKGKVKKTVKGIDPVCPNGYKRV